MCRRSRCNRWIPPGRAMRSSGAWRVFWPRAWRRWTRSRAPICTPRFPRWGRGRRNRSLRGSGSRRSGRCAARKPARLRLQCETKFVFDLVDLVFVRTSGSAAGLSVFEFLLGCGETLLESGHLGIGLGGRRLGFRRGALGGRGGFGLAGRFPGFQLGGCLVAKGGDRGRRLQDGAEIRAVLFGNVYGFGEEIAKPVLHGVFRLNAQVFTLLFPLLIFVDDIGHEEFRTS